LTKSELKTITGILTGHIGLKYHMHRIGKSRDENCRLCLEESKTAQDIMCECPAIARIRLKHFDKGYLSPNEVKVIKSKKILNFLSAIKLEEVLEQNWGIHKRSSQVEVKIGPSSVKSPYI
jgi:hypothetical protein